MIKIICCHLYQVVLGRIVIFVSVRLSVCLSVCLSDRLSVCAWLFVREWGTRTHLQRSSITILCLHQHTVDLRISRVSTRTHMPLFIFIDIGRVELRHAGPHYSLVSAHSFLEPLLLLFPTPTLQSEYCVDKSVYIQPFALLCPNLKPMNFLPPLLIHFHRNLSSSMFFLFFVFTNGFSNTFHRRL